MSAPFISGMLLLPDQYPFSVYNSCMGFSFDVWQLIFYTVFPILAAIPYADSLLRDIKSGYAKNLLLKAKREHYLFAKLAAVFTSGGLAVLLPLALNFYLTAMFLPTLLPHAATGFFPIFAYATGSALFYTHPFVYWLLFALLLFLTAGVLACTALAFSFFIRYTYIVLLCPFLLFLALSYAPALFPFGYMLDISEWILPTQGAYGLNISVALLELLLIFALTVCILMIRGKKDEAYLRL